MRNGEKPRSTAAAAQEQTAVFVFIKINAKLFLKGS